MTTNTLAAMVGKEGASSVLPSQRLLPLKQSASVAAASAVAAVASGVAPARAPVTAARAADLDVAA